MSFEGLEPAATGRPSYHPPGLLKLYIYGYLNRVRSSRRLEREAGRNEAMWLLVGSLPIRMQSRTSARTMAGASPVPVSSDSAVRWVFADLLQQHLVWSGFANTGLSGNHQDLALPPFALAQRRRMSCDSSLVGLARAFLGKPAVPNDLGDDLFGCPDDLSLALTLRPPC